MRVLYAICVIALCAVRSHCQICYYGTPNAEGKINNFGYYTLNAMNPRPVENFVYSPVSAYLALAPLRYGATENTESLLEQATALWDTPQCEGYPGVIDSLVNRSDVTLRISNRIYVKKEVGLSEEYQRLMSDAFHVDVVGVNFAESATEITKTVNRWIAQSTENNIPNFYKEDIDSNTKMLLVNAVYFKGKWTIPFDPKRTTKAPFYVSNGCKQEVEQMKAVDDFEYGELNEINSHYVKLTYGVGDNSPVEETEADPVSMYIVLSKDKQNFGTIHPDTKRILLSNLQGHTTRRLNLRVPKFEIEGEIDFGGVLKNIGLGGIFSSDATYGRITANSGLELSRITQKAVIKVDEEGTTAAGVTIAQLSYLMARPDPIPFIVDRPAHIIIATSKVILFRADLRHVGNGKQICARPEPLRQPAARCRFPKFFP